MGLFHKCILCVLLYEWHHKLSEQGFKLSKKPLKVLWNVPSFQCDPFRLNFSLILDKYHIIQNDNARFRGDKIVIMYDPGSFPAILETGNGTFLRNGGVPQEGNLTEHLDIFREILEQLIPSKNFSGLAIIDFESWRPIYRQNWGKLTLYKNLSEDIERQKHPTWPMPWVKKEAAKRFDESSQVFMEETLRTAKELRPNATWGYYAYPYCFNFSPGSMQKECSKQVQQENDNTKWLFEMSDNFYPSVYLQESQTLDQAVQRLEGRLDEAVRIRDSMKSRKNIYVYYWYKYQDSMKYVSQQNLFTTLTVLASYDIDGVVMWGASADVNSKANCLRLYDYVDKVLGPMIVRV
ncbi:hyaluronidase A-like isoform X1 [Sitophilus oryzae]|uniref:Hyaluronidase n=1 Tax=Sitophilus oryzae TaxID=7048 RepID=A0A6J2XU15_SITOR|nr:hyaluronidase A-like isoform X1 [Sitophilus oryzae]